MPKQLIPRLTPALLPVACVMIYAPNFGDFFLPAVQPLVRGMAMMPLELLALDSWRIAAMTESGISLAQLSFYLQAMLLDMLEPVSSRWINLVLHGINAMLCADVSYRALMARPHSHNTAGRAAAAALMGAAFWSLNPLQVDTVMTTLARGELLAVLISLLTVSQYIRWRSLDASPAAQSLTVAGVWLSLATVAAGLCDADGWLIPVYVLLIEATLFRPWSLGDTSADMQDQWRATSFSLLWVLALLPSWGGFTNTAVLPDGYYLALLTPCCLLTWWLTAWTTQKQGLTVLFGIPVLTLCSVLAFLQAGHWRNDTLLAEHRYQQDPETYETRVALARAYYAAAGQQKTDASARRFLTTAMRLAGDALALRPDRAAAHAELILLESLMNVDAETRYQLLADVLMRRAPDSQDMDSLRRLERCTRAEVCTAPAGGFENWLARVADHHQHEPLWDLLLEHCLMRSDYSCLRQRSQAVIDAAPDGFFAYRALYTAARAEGDIETAQATVLRMAQTNPQRRWQPWIRDFAAGRL
ncbi:MAG: hypothetical protein AAGI24_05360 [Pseudomonadota bacterium]